ncbi:hypothetical protein Tco_1030305 [Tanacetum coccineum]|uniref:Uncharacterized protein n=1 Tax=Tanacetum coccineum TaxID=301880 RepID=A0ABQ5G607_9ASTR
MSKASWPEEETQRLHWISTDLKRMDHPRNKLESFDVKLFFCMGVNSLNHEFPHGNLQSLLPWGTLILKCNRNQGVSTRKCVHDFFVPCFVLYADFRVWTDDRRRDFQLLFCLEFQCQILGAIRSTAMCLGLAYFLAKRYLMQMIRIHYAF